MINWNRLFPRLVPAVPVALILGSVLFSHSCANTTQAPTGGAKDTIPPRIVSFSPEHMSVNVPTHDTKLVFTFDEYVVLKAPSNIVLSPPQARAPKSRLRGKSVEVTFEEDLLPDMTYTLDFIDAIADNNEGNMFPGFTYVFSTGDTIDSLMITGIVQDCNTLDPVKGVTVMLYKDHADSAVMLSRPFAVTKTDDWGFFCIRNIKDTTYRLYAVKDGNSNNIYDPADNELIAFVDSLIRPVTVVNDSLPELQKLDMKDTVSCLSRKNEFELSLFREKPSKQMIMKKVRVSDRSSYLTFNAPNAHIDSMWVRGVPAGKLITQFNIQRDSLEVWVNEKSRQPDTLHMFVNYRKTDSTGRLHPSWSMSRSITRTTTSQEARRLPSVPAVTSSMRIPSACSRSLPSPKGSSSTVTSWSSPTPSSTRPSTRSSCVPSIPASRRRGWHTRLSLIPPTSANSP